MADKKMAKRRKKNQGEEDIALTKDEEEIAKYLRFNLESKKSTLLGDEAYYFYGSQAVDFLMDSKWTTGTYKSSVVFTHRESVCNFLNRLLGLRYFDHVHVIKTEKKVKKKDGEKKKEEGEKKDEADKKKKGGDKVKEDKEKDKTPGSPKTKKVKKKVKINLEPHEDQIFLDSEDEAYVWIFDPVSWKSFCFGILLVLAIIAVCLFPLWPENVREYSWYLSVAGAIFVGSILVLAILRYVIYGIIWVCTVGKLHFWLLPNLTAECGFFESFVPLYEYSVIKSQDDEKEEEKRQKKKTEKRVVSDKEKSGSDKEEKSVLDANNEKEEADGVEELSTSSPDITQFNIIEDTPTEIPLKATDSLVELSGNTKPTGIEEVNDIPDEKDSPAIEVEANDSGMPAEEDKFGTESEESNGSCIDGESWVKVKKNDVNDEAETANNGSEVAC